MIASIQELLTALGYDVGPADGAVGQRTRRAIVAFQRKAGLTADGRPSEALYARLTRALNQGDGSQQMGAAKRAAGRPNPREAAALPTEATAAALARIAPAAGTTGPVKPASPDQIRDIVPPVDQEIVHGVHWRIFDSNGASFELVLEPGGRVTGTAVPQFWHWEQTGDTIRLIFDNQWGGRIVRTGHVVGNRIIGSADGNGQKWTWKAVRLPDRPDQAGWSDNR